tara:strand:+ start:172 stop:624 length:453 start_codon:yes stop_codon:yes gene_type:complete
MKKIIFIVLASVLFYGCGVTKNRQKTKEERTLKESTEIITTRVGDTVTYEVPLVRFKDTTIVKRNYVTGTTQTLRYNGNGQIDLAQCISGSIERIERSNKELIEAILTKDKETKHEVKPTIILYGFIGLALIIVISVGAFIFYIKKYIPI